MQVKVTDGDAVHYFNLGEAKDAMIKGIGEQGYQRILNDLVRFGQTYLRWNNRPLLLERESSIQTDPMTGAMYNSSHTENSTHSAPPSH